ncbi:conserved hypothetical protein [Histoplasma capsulatum G186AR]|uniref:Uncharacterized protein n=2 Tax=Ajellomyces capsulatus TaxID=5037 RepID=C0NA87_AJECG|nr:uncharacterized protein HCBG_00033 [Histoplasma capsulatum G186AR]EEH10578.1 conserved hypothetical protein [Histoplasma capsulatum G186AR]KAG5288463.1 hypothetical protein I7I52_11959 [Histoplasma capsulatum]QSS71038.1 hypothetical protein I7I50_01745 [Histoplasma capsulatum G186AR]
MGLPIFSWLQRAVQRLSRVPEHQAKQGQDIATSTDDFRRTMGAGKCTVTWVSGQLNIPCPCSNGIFEVPFPTDSVQCRLCAHALSNHEDFDFIVPPQKATAPQTSLQNIQLQTVPERDLESDHAQLNNPGPPDINSLEDESPRISRDVTVRALWKRVKETGVVHIRGTPASGKSNLARLLRRHVAKTSEMPVISLSWPMDFPQNLPTNAMYYKLLNAITVRPLDLDDWLEKRVLLIIDEAQGSYPYTSFWNDFIKFISPGLGPCVAMFSSYGSPSGRPLDEQTPTPILLLPSQRISLLRTPINPDVGLYFSLEEYHSVVRAVCKYYGQDGQQFLLCENLKNFIWEITCGHPSAVRSLLDGLACADAFREYRKRSTEITLEAAREFLSDDASFLNCLENSKMHGFCRGLPAKYMLQANPSVSQFLREIVVDLVSTDDPNSNPALNTCYRKGWLQAELLEENKPIYIFSTGIHRRYIEHLLSIDTPPFPFHLFPTIEDLSFAAIREFKPAGLRVEQRGSAFTPATRPLEATFQNEFYRACYELLGKRLYLSSEWTGTAKGGRVDFQVRGTRWAIEILRDGDNIDEHVARFQTGGRYFPWLQAQEIQEYIILDFRRTQPPKKLSYNRVFYVVFSEDYTMYQLFNSKLDRIGDSVALLA